MDKSTLFAAKSNKEGLWECVPQHLQDTANVMKCLCDTETGWVSRSFIEAAGMDASSFTNVCVFIAATHDIAKLTPVFQNKISSSLPGLRERLLSKGFDIELDYIGSSFNHAFVSGAILHEQYNVEESVCEIIAAHHGIPREDGREFRWTYPFRHHKEYIVGKNHEYVEVWDEIVCIAEEASGISCSSLPRLTYAAQLLISGLLITADWIASNEWFFPLSKCWEVDSLHDKARGEKGYGASGVRRGWFSTVHSYDKAAFTERFGFEPNGLQNSTGAAAEAGAKLLIVEGPMGAGKTEAALMSAEIMAGSSGSGGFYIGLPTQATSNGLFPRILFWASKVSSGLSVSVNLAHGGALYNDAFKALKVNTSEDIADGISVNEWMSGRHRKLMADFVDGTIDQALAMTKKKKYFMLLHEQLAGKVVVLDEVHSYDAYTSAYLETTLAYLGYYHCPVVLLSATLTNQKRLDFIKAYTQRKVLSIQESSTYPCISWWEGSILHEDKVLSDGMKKMKVGVQWLQFQQLPETIKVLLSDGGCAGAIRNTVKEAIRTYCLLKESLSDYRVILIHSRFLMDDRSKLEDEIVRLTGKRSTSQERDRLIVVGTQVLEQSLDLDFDVLFTDPCPMDLFFQRLGREHRHDRIRPKGLENAMAYMIFDEEKMIGTNGRPYSSYIMNRTCELLSSVNGKIVLPDDIKAMVEKTYDVSITEDSPDKREYLEQLFSLKNGSMQMRIPEPWNTRSIRGLASRQPGNFHHDDHDSVRQGDDSITVVLLKLKDGAIMTIDESAFCKVGCIPDEDTSEVFLRQVIRIPSYMIRQEELEEMKEQTGFGRESIWRYKAILLLDEHNSYEHTAYDQNRRYIYDPKMGLMEEENG